MGEGRFIGCAQLLLAWFHSHFWKVDKVSYRVFSVERISSDTEAGRHYRGKMDNDPSKSPR
ncbi:hypothetical protein Golax_003878 [Gossypium laxum]|uniref:Uncharacterized protein n=1 Tax=Gossypium laxum TaxID=34288 RepID=A0A7J9AGT7_9ROSI|nr:hypothetical protein [Gossypium laxum]